MKVYKDCKIRMSEKAMGAVLYAVIMTQSQITNSYGIGIYEYNRKQNSFNFVQLKIYIEEEKISEFEQLSGAKLKNPIEITI